MTTSKAIKKAIRRAIVDRDQPQEIIAALAKIHPTRLSQIIHGRGQAPSESERLRLAGVLQKSEAELFGDEAIAS